MINPIKLVFCLALFAAVCALEVFLSKRRAWWPGLVLPGLWLAYTLLAAVCAVTGYAQAYGEPLPLTAELAVSLPLNLLLANIPTLLLLGLYALCRSRRRRKKQMERMQVQDL